MLDCYFILTMGLETKEPCSMHFRQRHCWRDQQQERHQRWRGQQEEKNPFALRRRLCSAEKAKNGSRDSASGRKLPCSEGTLQAGAPASHCSGDWVEVKNCCLRCIHFVAPSAGTFKLSEAVQQERALSYLFLELSVLWVHNFWRKKFVWYSYVFWQTFMTFIWQNYSDFVAVIGTFLDGFQINLLILRNLGLIEWALNFAPRRV